MGLVKRSLDLSFWVSCSWINSLGGLLSTGRVLFWGFPISLPPCAPHPRDVHQVSGLSLSGSLIPTVNSLLVSEASGQKPWHDGLMAQVELFYLTSCLRRPINVSSVSLSHDIAKYTKTHSTEVFSHCFNKTPTVGIKLFFPKGTLRLRI